LGWQIILGRFLRNIEEVWRNIGEVWRDPFKLRLGWGYVFFLKKGEGFHVSGLFHHLNGWRLFNTHSKICYLTEKG